MKAVSEAKARELTDAIKEQVATGDVEQPNEAVRRLVKEHRKLQADFLRLIRTLQRTVGITEAEIRAIERAAEADQLPGGEDFWRAQVLQSRATEDLNALAAVGLQRLLRIVDPEWLRVEAQKEYHLSSSFLNHPLHLVNGVRVGMAPNAMSPQRFARMLLVSQDHLNKRPDLDFFAASMFVPEVAILGNSLDEIAALGPEAEDKLRRLGSVPDDNVTSTIFELLVGAACVRRGLAVSMVAENRSEKVPDFRISGLGPYAGAIECKRRLGLTSYELDETGVVESLYSAVRLPLRERGVHGSIEAAFGVELRAVPCADFVAQVLSIVSAERDHEPTATGWGSLAFRRLPYYDGVQRTRLYSPDYLERVFTWDALQDDWDGLLCEVEPPTRIEVESFRNPMCLKWRSESDTALTKKSRGISSLWVNAVRQIPPGEVGFIYIAYPEGSRSAIADARTRHILETMAEAWHRWYVRVPVSVVSRLYPRSLAEGRPDLIESALPGAAKGQEFWLTKVPRLIFTRQFE